jgi:hypothetical protein
MEAMLNPQNENQSSSLSNKNTDNEKSDLMKYFEYQVHDMYWAYKDLLKEIFESDKETDA